jgi:hypothetical protein
MASPLSTDELTLHLVATGLIALTQRAAQNEALYPYPEALQRGLDRLTVAALRHHVAPPQGVPTLLDWCRAPIHTWPLDLPEGLIEPHDTLLIGSQPSSTCDAWACARPDAEAELTEQRLMQRVFDLCSQTHDTDGYVAFRSLLITAPAMTALELQQQCIRSELLRLADVLRDSYQQAPSGWANNGIFTCCAHCQNLLIPLATGGYVCETETCRHESGSLLGRQIAAHEMPMWLVRGLRRFVAGPGRAEQRLASAVIALGLGVEMWPALDRYDLRITLPNGNVWAIDVKDWANPYLLARQLQSLPSDPSWNRAFIVVPNHRLKQRRDYLRALRKACTNTSFTIASERDLLGALKKYA